MTPLVDEATFNRWKFSDESARTAVWFDKLCKQLRAINYSSVYYTLRYGSRHDDAEQFANDSYPTTLEEIDLHVSGGAVLSLAVEEAGESGVTTIYFRGYFTGRARERPTPVEWRGDVKFNAFVRKCWINRARDCRRSRLNDGRELTLGEELEADLPNPMGGLDFPAIRSRFVLECIVLELAKLAPELSQPSASIVRSTLAYIKWRIAECSDTWKDAKPKDIAKTTVTVLLADADLSCLEFSKSAWLGFIYKTRLPDPTDRESQQKLAQPIHRLKPRLMRIFNECRQGPDAPLHPHEN
jgi:hypothetical protein